MCFNLLGGIGIVTVVVNVNPIARRNRRKGPRNKECLEKREEKETMHRAATRKLNQILTISLFKVLRLYRIGAS